jgi:hypothetical protein
MNSDQLVNNSICVLSRAKIVDELERLCRHADIQVDKKGHKRSLYERQAEFILSRFNLWKSPPSFIFHTTHLVKGSPLEREFNDLDDDSLDDVMREVIYRLLDSLNFWSIQIQRRNINWEIAR